LLTGKQHQVILITSSMSGEGKSFISLNLAASLAISGKKVVLLELDLRKPRLSSELGLKNEIGFTNFIVSNTELKYLPKPVPDHPNLYIINSGPIPTNPAELIMQDKVKVLFEYLYANYDYIVIDTPPLGLVTDALLVAPFADTCLYVTRQNYTLKQQITLIEDIYRNRRMKGLSVLINDVDGGNGYGYGYGYGYGKGSYYTDEPKPKRFWKRFFSNKGKKTL
jgi:tyrosine-protein kinase Etk/Wzc